MQDKVLYEYAIIRLVPRPERGEFINIGVILFAKRTGFLEVLYKLDENRILTLYPETNIEEIKTHLQSFDGIAKGVNPGSPIATQDAPSRFRWLTAKRSTVIQTSEVHSGFCKDPVSALKKLHQELVEN